MKRRKMSTKKNKQSNNKFQKLNKETVNFLDKAGLPTNNIQFIPPPDNIKMSNVILKLVEPTIEEHCSNDKQLKSLISLAIIAWNISIYPHEEQEQLHEKIIDKFVPPDGSAEDYGALYQIVDILLSRKREYYPDLRKLILNYNLTISNGDITLDITSAPIEAL